MKLHNDLKRVLILFSSSDMGGAERSLTRMALSDLMQQSYDVRLGTNGPGGKWCEWVHDLGHHPVIFGYKQQSRFNLRAVLKVISYIRNEKISIVYICGIRLAFILRFCRIFMPRVKIIHGVRANYDSDTLLDRVFKMIEYLLHDLIDYYITNSHTSSMTLEKKCHVSPLKIGTIYNGISSLGHATDCPPYTDRPLNILTIANLAPRKGYLEYLHIIHRVLAIVPMATFTFIGRDDMAGAVSKAITTAGLDQAVRYIGFQENVQPFLAQARIFVLPSLYREGIPTSILESMLQTIPVVAYGIDGIPEIITDGQNGYTIPPHDQDLFARRLIYLLQNPDIAASMGKWGREKVIAGFTLEKCVENHILAFGKVINQ